MERCHTICHDFKGLLFIEVTIEGRELMGFLATFNNIISKLRSSSLTAVAARLRSPIIRDFNSWRFISQQINNVSMANGCIHKQYAFTAIISYFKMAPLSRSKFSLSIATV